MNTYVYEGIEGLLSLNHHAYKYECVCICSQFIIHRQLKAVEISFPPFSCIPKILLTAVANIIRQKEHASRSHAGLVFSCLYREVIIKCYTMK